MMYINEILVPKGCDINLSNILRDGFIADGYSFYNSVICNYVLFLAGNNIQERGKSVYLQVAKDAVLSL